ncbi:3-mercaptopyruvate sulfurtransferase [Aurantiacibacter xanthus]|uniref:Sulfurtransferase n=1 Tax=Aurantiacibacter xanthus TaxID=1784712 RepID=A0A3A1P124_9SPHN|nr:3-mercaptopyruvate sulfurtransferase [Aurantiacibacter xanthus]RIV82626.1 3-mercaptopyruvate sulfurtransferase [Aurantiacibacter xanthus]
MTDLVSTDWLAGQLDAPDICIVDATRHHFEPERDSAAEYAAGHIPGAVFLDLLTLVDPDAATDNTLPTKARFEQRMRQLGIDNSQRIVIYDDSVVKTAMRAWFMFRLFGLEQVYVLDGGLARWKAEGRPLESGEVSRPASSYVASFDPSRLYAKGDVLANIETRERLHLDGRGSQHFTGQDDDPTPGIAPGHVPGSINVPFWDLFTPEGLMKSDDELRALFAGHGVDTARPAVVSCGGGVVACALALALRRLGNDEVALYDGSWTEWGADPALPKALGTN